MPVTANAVETYDVTDTIREDLREAYSMISPEETPFQTAVGTRDITQWKWSWPAVELQAPAPNRVVEGETAPGVDVPTLPFTYEGVAQISDKVAEVTHTAQAVDAAAENIQRLAGQIVLKLKELKRDKEYMLLENVGSDVASSGNPRQSAGLPAWLKTNVDFGVGGANATFSSATGGFPTSGVTAGTARLFEELTLNDVIELCWNEGAEPSMIMCNGGNKRRVSQSFTGNSTRYKDANDKRALNIIDFYETDLAPVLTVVPNRFQPTNNPGGADDSYNVFVLDPEYIKVAYLDAVQQKPLAETGHAMSNLIWCEYGLQVDNEKAHACIRDTSNALA